jgi:hypothetical protein
LINRYSNWHHGGVLCEVPQDLLDLLKNYYDVLSKSPPEFDRHQYKQWHVQYCKIHNLTAQKSDSNYWAWKDKSLMMPVIKHFTQYVPFIYRFRFSLMEPGQTLDYHGLHYLPRIHIPLNKCKSSMIIKDYSEVEHEIPLEYGKAYYTNVTKPHKVIGDTDKFRMNAFFSFMDFATEEIKKKYANEDI